MLADKGDGVQRLGVASGIEQQPRLFDLEGEVVRLGVHLLRNPLNAQIGRRSQLGEQCARIGRAGVRRGIVAQELNRVLTISTPSLGVRQRNRSRFRRARIVDSAKRVHRRARRSHPRKHAPIFKL